MMDCTEVRKSYQLPIERRKIEEHISQCTTCFTFTEKFFVDLHNRVCDAEAEFIKAEKAFYDYINGISTIYNRAGMVDAKRYLTQVICEQVFQEYRNYWESHPIDTAYAFCWLQKAFVLCRFFESAKNFPHSGSIRVGDMNVPKQPAIKKDDTLKFAEATSLSFMPDSQTEYGELIKNPELYKLMNDALISKNYITAINLACESPKHAVLSSFELLALHAHTERIYEIGLQASAIAIRGWLASKL